MLASTGSPIDPSVIDRTAELAAELSTSQPVQVIVVSVARIWGTKLGLPNPGLYPHKREWDEQRQIGHSLKAESIRRECEASLRRLRVDVLDLYQIKKNAYITNREVSAVLGKLKVDSQI